MQEKDESKKTKIKNICCIFIIIVSIIVCGLYIKNNYIDNHSGNISDVKNNGKVEDISLPEDVEYKEYNDKILSVKCVYSNTGSNVSVISKGDSIKCNVDISLKENYKIEELYFTLEHDKSYNYNNYELKNKSWSALVDDTPNISDNSLFSLKNVKLLPSEYYSKDTSIISFMFDFPEEGSSYKLNLVDIIFKNSDGFYYKTNNVELTFEQKGSEYYIYTLYDDNDDYDLLVYKELQSDSKYNFIDLYKCDTINCTYKSWSGDYILFSEHNVLIAYNYKTKKKVNIINESYNYDEIELIADSKLIGLIVKDENDLFFKLDSKSDNNSLKSYSVSGKELNYLYNYDCLINYNYNSGNNTYVVNIVNTDGSIFNPNISNIKRINNSDIYYIQIDGDDDFWELYYLFTNKDAKPLLGKRLILENEYIITNDGNLIVPNEDYTSYVTYDSNGKIISTSKKYKEIGAYTKEGYIGVIDTDNYLKVIDINGNIMATFIEMKDNYEFHPALSGWYSENGKNGIYLVVGDKNYDDDDTGKGYEFYYIPSTNESGTIETEGVGGYAKPVLYLYPKNDNTKINVTFEHPLLLTTSYPKYTTSWNVTTNKNGDLYDVENNYYYALYWEEKGSSNVNFSEGFYVTKNNAIDFLETKLSIIGLNAKERNEFIMYWLPVLEKNEKSLVYFELTEDRNNYNKLYINPTPDSLLRVAIHIKKVNKKISIKEQQLPSFNRKGFTAVEWGGVIH